MKKGIELIMNAASYDLSASYCAVELAKRMKCSVYALIIEADALERELQEDEPILSSNIPDNVLELFRVLTSLADAEGIHLSCHFLRDQVENELMEFLKVHRISCIILSASDQLLLRDNADFVVSLNERLCQEKDWYQGPIKMLVARPWDKDTFEQVIRELNRSLDSKC